MNRKAEPLQTASGETGAEFRGLLTIAHAAWPMIQVEGADFARHLEDLAKRSPRDWTTAKLHASDLFLAYACASGDAIALAQFDKLILSGVAAYLARLDPSAAFADEVRQCLREKLFVPSAGSPPKIAAYAGLGPLGAWVRVVAIRVARDLLRSRKRKEAPPDGSSLRPPGPDPELHYMKRHYGSELHDAFEKTLSGLSVKERNVLCLHFLEGMSSAAIGTLYGVQGATVRLWIKGYRESLLAETRRILAERLHLRSNEIDGVIELVQSQLQVSISRLLREKK